MTVVLGQRVEAIYVYCVAGITHGNRTGVFSTVMYKVRKSPNTVKTQSASMNNYIQSTTCDVMSTDALVWF